MNIAETRSNQSQGEANMNETLKRAAELLRQYGRMANTVKAYQGDETLQVAADIERMAQAAAESAHVQEGGA